MATRTAARKRADERMTYNVYVATCPSRQVLDTLSDKWVSLIVHALADGRLRYSELRKRIMGVSQKMLTQSLRTLEREGIVTRTLTAAVPVRVDYELTEVGQTLVPIMDAIKVWAETHIDYISSSRTTYDARSATEAATT